MHLVAFAFQVIDFCRVQPPHAAVHRHGQVMPLPLFQLSQRLLQLLRKRKVGHRFQHIIQRPNGISADGILRHVGNEHNQHPAVPLPDAAGGLHAVQVLHLHIQKDDVELRAVIFQNLHPVRKLRYLKRRAVLPGVPLHIPRQLFPHRRLVLHNRNPGHLLLPFLNITLRSRTVHIWCGFLRCI